MVQMAVPAAYLVLRSDSPWGMAEQTATLEGVCHGDWGGGRQGHLQCTLKDVLLDSYFIAQVLPRAMGLRCRTPFAP